MANTTSDAARVEDLIAERVAQRAPEWFPEVERPSVRVYPLRVRPKCSLYGVRLRDDVPTTHLLAKVRRDSPGRTGETPTEGRPRLHAVPTTAAEYTRLEYEGLQLIAQAFSSCEAFGVIRPLDQLPEHGTLLMDYVRARTLRDAFLAESRLRIPGRVRRPAVMAWQNAGAWLRRFHDGAPASTLPEQQPRRADVVERFSEYGSFLSSRLGRPSIAHIAASSGETAGRLLPERLPLVTGHGDYAPRNVFVRQDGQVTVFDPMPRWRLPRHEDLGRFTIGMRLLGLQISSFGAAYSQSALEHREHAFLAGYFGQQPIPVREIRSYQLLILFDKWAALVDAASSGRGWRSRARGLASAPTHEYVRREAGRLLAAAQREDSQPDVWPDTAP